MKITQGLIPINSQDVAIGGLTGRFWLINEADYRKAVITEADGEITAIAPGVLAAGEQFAYRFVVPPNSMATGNALTVNDSYSGLTHSVTAFLGDLSSLQKTSLANCLNFNRVKIIVETQGVQGSPGGTNKSPQYVLSGKVLGLEMTVTETNLGDQATGNGHLLTFTSPSKSRLELEFPTNIQMDTGEIEILETVGT